VVESSQLILFAVATIGATVSALTGLGGGSVVLALLLIFYPPIEALALHSFTLLTSNFLRSSLAWREVAWPIVGRYALLLLPGAYLASKMLGLIDPAYLQILIGVMIIVSIYVPLPAKFQIIPPNFFIPLGFVSGVLGMLVGSVGPFVAPFFQKAGLPRQSQIVTKSAAQMILQLSKIIAFGSMASFDMSAIGDKIFILIGGVIVGVMVAIPISKKISDRLFDKIVNILLTIIAMKTIYTGVANLLNF